MDRGELLLALREHAGLELATLEATDGGESGSSFWATERAGTVSIIKVLPAAGPGAVTGLRELETTTRRLRDRGYPAPRLRASGYVPGMIFWAQEQLPGAPLDPASQESGVPDLAALHRLLPEIFRLSDAQAGLGTRAGQWPDRIRQSLTAGCDGYCVHATLQADPGTRDLLAWVRGTGDRYCGDIPDGEDYVHYDFTPANMLWDGTSISGVIDVNPPVIFGDRAFDLACMLFYVYDHEALRDRLRARLLELAEPGVACTYLAHIVLRQVDWSLRFHPGTAATRRHLRLARLVAGDFGQLPER